MNSDWRSGSNNIAASKKSANPQHRPPLGQRSNVRASVGGGMARSVDPTVAVAAKPPQQQPVAADNKPKDHSKKTQALHSVPPPPGGLDAQAQTLSAAAVAAAAAAAEPAKRLRNARKLLRQIETLQQQADAPGAVPLAEKQKTKLARRAEVEATIAECEAALAGR